MTRVEFSLDLYRVFDAIWREKSFTGAARRLYISQPAISQAAKQLEEAAGARLFVRGSRGVTLTPEGEILREYVSAALNLLSEGERRIAGITRLDQGELHIGAGDTVSRWYLLPRIEKFHKMYPGVEIHMTNRTSDETVALLKEGRLDLGFVNLPMSAQGVVFQQCIAVHDVFVAGEKYAELKGRTVTLEELVKYPLIMLERASNSRRRVDRHFLENGLVPRAGIELGSHDLLDDYAGIGVGIACVIREFTPSIGTEEGLFEIKLDKPVPERGVGVCYLEDISLSAAARRFVELVKG